MKSLIAAARTTSLAPSITCSGPQRVGSAAWTRQTRVNATPPCSPTSDARSSALVSPAEELDIVLTNLGGDSNYTMFVVGYPGFPMPQALDARRGIIESSVQRLGELAATT